MITYIVVTTQADQDIIDALLADLIDSYKTKIRFIVGGSKNSALPWARHIQLDKHEPVVLVANSDMPDEDESVFIRRDLEFYLRESSGGVPYHVCLFVPTIEQIFFTSKYWLETSLGTHIHESLFNAGQYAPKQILRDLMRSSEIDTTTDLLRKFDSIATESIRNIPVVSNLRHFVTNP